MPVLFNSILFCNFDTYTIDMKILRIPVLFKTKKSEDFNLINDNSIIPIDLFNTIYIPMNIGSILYIEPLFNSDLEIVKDRCTIVMQGDVVVTPMSFEKATDLIYGKNIDLKQFIQQHKN